MKIFKNHVYSIAFLSILLSVVVFMYVKQSNSRVKNNKVESKEDTGHALQEAPTYNYIIKKQLNSMGSIGENVAYSDIQIPQLVNTNNNKVWNKINQDIINDFKRFSCPDLEDINSINNTFDTAKNFFKDVNFNDVNDKEDKKIKANMTKEEKIKYIYSSGIGSDWRATSTYIGNHIFSVVINFYSECGGAHPSGSVYGLNYNLDKWKVSANKKEDMQGNNDDVKQIDFSDIFVNYEKDKVAIEKIVLGKVIKMYDATDSDLKSCFDYISSPYDDDVILANGYALGIEPFYYSLNEKGINLLSFGLPHVIAACEPTPTLIPYESLHPYIKPEFLKLIKALK